MDEDLHDALIHMLTEERARGLDEAVKLPEDERKGSVGGCMEAGGGGGDADGSRGDTETETGRDVSQRGGGGGGDGEKKVWKRKVLERLQKLTHHYLDRVTAWREVVRKWECSNDEWPLEGSDGHRATGEADTSLRSVFQSVSEDINVIITRLNMIVTRLDDDLMLLSLDTHPQQPAEVDTAPRDSSQSPTPSPPDDPLLTSADPSTFDQADDGTDLGQPESNTATDTDEMLDCGLHEVKERHGDNDSESPETDGGATDKDSHKKDGEDVKLLTVGLPGHQDMGQSLSPDACYVRAPAGVSQLLRCDVADALSCLMVTGAEELVSGVLRLRVRESARVPFPVTVVVPFYSRYRGNYRDIAVKVVDAERRVSYICPATSEGRHGGQRSSFAEVKVYSLGLFAVVSCLKRESYTVPRRGLSLKLSMDCRICLNYLPGSFTAPVMAQAMIQPVDAVLLAAVRSRGEDYRPVVSTSPIVFLTHPSCQALKRPLTITLPCAPKPKHTTTQLEEVVLRYSHLMSSAPRDSTPRVRMLQDVIKSTKDAHNEILVLLGYKDKEWNVMEKITVKNQQKGLASFEMTENIERLIVIRLLSPLSPCRLVGLVEDLEGAVCCHAVTVALLKRKDDPRAMLLALVPSRDLSWELSRLRAQGYSGTADSSTEIAMCEGDQLLLRFSGNIASTEALHNQNERSLDRITFHCQRTNHLHVRLSEVDPFGNHSSSHYKGTAVFYKVSRGQLDWSCDCPELGNIKPQGDPICKLPLTLPKRVRNITRPVVTPVKICETTTHSLSDSLLLWLSGQLSAEELSRLVLSLRLRRSAAQLVKLRAGSSLSAQAFHLLLMWRRALPASPHQSNLHHLARCLAKSGRPDLAGELLLREAAHTSEESEQKEEEMG